MKPNPLLSLTEDILLDLLSIENILKYTQKSTRDNILSTQKRLEKYYNSLKESEKFCLNIGKNYVKMEIYKKIDLICADSTEDDFILSDNGKQVALGIYFIQHPEDKKYLNKFRGDERVRINAEERRAKKKQERQNKKKGR